MSVPPALHPTLHEIDVRRLCLWSEGTFVPEEDGLHLVYKVYVIGLGTRGGLHVVHVFTEGVYTHACLHTHC